MRKRKKTAVHGTLKMTYKAVKFNLQQVLLKTLIPRMNTLKDMAVLNIIKTDGKCAYSKSSYCQIEKSMMKFLSNKQILGRK